MKRLLVDPAAGREVESRAVPWLCTTVPLVFTPEDGRLVELIDVFKSAIFTIEGDIVNGTVIAQCVIGHGFVVLAEESDADGAFLRPTTGGEFLKRNGVLTSLWLGRQSLRPGGFLYEVTAIQPSLLDDPSWPLS
jgi:hypothetical protein